MRKNIDKIIAVTLFSVAFGLVEAMVVIYLRQILITTVGDIFSQADFLSTKAQLFSLGFVVFLDPAVLSAWDTLHLELFRETATIIMLATIAWVASAIWRERLAFFLLSFGTWDIFYYIWLYLFIGWPNSLLNKDFLFLIPVPWVSWVFVPVGISICMIIFALWLLEWGKGASRNKAKI